ncbi:MAG: aromatic hydrocarbon degradation protein [Pseudomonadales bacterium]|nr:aromatic hydrocarbon degradation protein [Pseudomonadales bacterium]
MMTRLLQALVALMGAATFSLSQAALVENLTMGNAKALALGNAVTADPPGVDSIHYNPAGLAQLKGRQYNLKVLAAAMTFKVEFGGYDEVTQMLVDNNGYNDVSAYQTSETSTIGLRIPYTEGITEWPLPVLILPLGGASFNPPDTDVTYATAVYAPMAAGYVRDDDDPARFMGQHMSLAKITYFSPSFGVQLTDRFSVGASLGFSWQGVTAKTQIRVPNMALAFGENLTRDLQNQGLCPDPADPEPYINFCGIDPSISRLGPFTDVTSLEFDAETPLVPNFNVGWLWQVTDWLRWGMVYQFESKGDLDGYYRLEYNEEWVNFFDGIYQSGLYSAITSLVAFPTGLADSPLGRGIEYGDAKLEIITPAHFATGVVVQVTPKWQVNIDAKWTDWAVWDGLKVEFDKPLDFTKLATLVSSYSELTELTIPRHYKSVWNWAFGVEYQYSNRLALRAGYEPRKSSIPDDKQDVLLPLGDADLYTVGFEWRMPGDKILEVGVGYMTASADVPAGSSTNANSSDHFNNFIYNPYAGTDFSSSAQAYLFELSYTAPF